MKNKPRNMKFSVIVVFLLVVTFAQSTLVKDYGEVLTKPKIGKTVVEAKVAPNESATKTITFPEVNQRNILQNIEIEIER